MRGVFFLVRYTEEEIDSVRKSHKLTNPHCDSPSEGIFARELSLRNPKPEQNESRKQIIGAIVTDAFSLFSPPENWNTLFQLKKPYITEGVH